MEFQTYDLSARGIIVTLSYNDGQTLALEDFSEDQDPLMIDDINYGDPIFDINQDMFRKGKLESVSCHLAVIPGSEAEKELNKLVLQDLPMFNGPIKIDTLSIEYSSDEGKSYSFYNGFFTGASMGYAATSQGRIRTKNYSFAFKSCGKMTSNK